MDFTKGDTKNKNKQESTTASKIKYDFLLEQFRGNLE